MPSGFKKDGSYAGKVFQKGDKPKVHFKKGCIPWNKGIHMWENREHPKGMFGKKCSKNTRKQMSKSKMGHSVTEKTREKISDANKTQILMGFKKGHKPFNYIDGRTKLVKMIKIMKEYLEWRSAVFKRDNYHCQNCGEKGYLEAHHIIPFIKILREFKIKNFEDARKCKLLWDVGNGISYCRDCHILKDKNRGRELQLIKLVH